jgi:hypothetical protein
VLREFDEDDDGGVIMDDSMILRFLPFFASCDCDLHYLQDLFVTF